MTDQPDLFPPFSEPTTSKAAAASMVGESKTIRERIFRLVVRYGGLTCEELCDYTGLDGNTVRPRLWELTGQAQGYPARLVKTHKRRVNASGRSARIYEPV